MRPLGPESNALTTESPSNIVVVVVVVVLVVVVVVVAAAAAGAAAEQDPGQRIFGQEVLESLIRCS